MTPPRSIWKYAPLLKPAVTPKYQYTLNEGQTPLVKIEDLYFKREDLNPTGSIKDRGLAYQISALSQQGFKKFVISSSGNAAISAAAYCQLAGAELTAFVSPTIGSAKLTQLQSYPVHIFQDSRPISSATRFSQAKQAYNLRPSLDPLGPIGYQTLAYELQSQLPDIGAIFFSVSSATTFVGVGQAYHHHPQSNTNGPPPQFHAVQTSRIHPITSRLDPDFTPTDSSLASGLVAKVVPRKSQALDLIQTSGGSGWTVSDSQITTAHDWLEDHQLFTSYEGAAALAGLFKARQNNWPVSGPIVCLLTGTLN